MTIEEFIEARLAEDEAGAQAARVEVGRQWDHDDYFVSSDGDPFATSATSELLSPVWTHVARHDPARMGRQVAGLRRLVALTRNRVQAGWGDAADLFIIDELRPIADIWSDHPDYRAVWSPLET